MHERPHSASSSSRCWRHRIERTPSTNVRLSRESLLARGSGNACQRTCCCLLPCTELDARPERTAIQGRGKGGVTTCGDVKSHPLTDLRRDRGVIVASSAKRIAVIVEQRDNTLWGSSNAIGDMRIEAHYFVQRKEGFATFKTAPNAVVHGAWIRIDRDVATVDRTRTRRCFHGIGEVALLSA